MNRILTALTASVAAFAGTTASAGEFATAHYTTPLADVCPSPFYIQKDWLAQAEHGGLYQMIGAGGTMESGAYRGPLGATGIELAILEGGGGIGLGDGETAYSALFNGNSKAGVIPHLGFQELDNAYIFSNLFPVVGVFVPLDIAPSGLIWDTGTYPDGFHSVDDLKAFGESGAGMIYVSTITRTFGLWLVEQGVSRDAFVEGYRGDLENFVANNGTWLNQGFVTTEVFNLSNGMNWAKPVDAVTVNELGYPTITGMVSVAQPRLEELAPCLELLVPIMQQAAVDYINDPAEVNQLIADFTAGGFSASWWRATPELNAYSAAAQRDRGIVGNGNNATIGDFDLDRAAAMLELVKPMLDDRANPDVTVDDVVTNRFINPEIGL
ncbi:hypothetical protein [Ketogulonicigenium vulgare]|uniref:ABC transporter substrate-binding protein n=1 Tax=Ketogulonicigenium vulgare (strain WSH-001) TaxID=759362 RepID=F9YA63_KETVW|nr:hypothetical protein [Ketogulonicigenium vulgare]ADO43175.1 conserved hypothetical protein [Ketogulonicigenium vulgare Y25]AEM41474.1 hypothetical protein KVU_1635 [Ketogulonicigenium vulgare WSH-001]ALJ81604.1 hypothetical protein KVH_10720 [Ketogulonicigenium vulgare]ANW34281.1 hypothetical protein KvSKV_10635 [Ketogulonicigenium vulgare]AOZ55213.1 ABC transporter substrate-binding protein [Ketogulonicigenium vulgare]